MSSRASTWVTEPSAEVPEPAARPGRRRRGGLRAEAIPARCTARRNIPFRMSWRRVSCAARARHRLARLVSERRSVAPEPHWEAEAVVEGGLYFPVLERQGVQERESFQPRRGRAACAADVAIAIAFARIRAGVIGGKEGIKADLGCMPRVGTLCFGDVS
jgi:hypothetical protein